jgi:hypothetical protein
MDDARRTRLGYKNQQKTKAFTMIDDLVLKLNLHQAVTRKAREE